MLNSAEYSDKVKELSDVNAGLAKLKAKKSELEAWFAVIGNEALKDSKSKSISYNDGSGSSVVYTEAQKLTLESPGYLKKLLGDVFPDFIEERTSRPTR